MRSQCPHCQREQLPEDEQPVPGTHAYSTKYKCGAQIVYVLGGDYWEWEQECPVEVEDDGK